MTTESIGSEEHNLTPMGSGKGHSAAKISSPAAEKEQIKPLRGDTDEVTFVKLQEAKTSHWVALIRYFGGIGIIAIITFIALYIFAFENTGPAYGDAVKLLFLIAGAIVGSIYASNTR